MGIPKFVSWIYLRAGEAGFPVAVRTNAMDANHFESPLLSPRFLSDYGL
jgi:hypothetical protein